jgi:dihydrofolate reductase
MILWGSISLAQSLMRENLIDEYHIQLCPVLTAGGRSLFTEQFNPRNMQLLEVRQYTTGTIFINYKPATDY